MTLSIWTPLFIALLLGGANLVRRFAPALHFLHSTAGTWVIATTAGLIDAIAEAARSGGFSLAVVIPASVAFLTSAISASNPSLAADGTNKATGLGKLAAMLPLMFVAFTLAGCPSAGGQALKNCEIGKLAGSAQAAVVTAEQIAMNPSSAVADLEQAALTFLPGQFDCALQALAAWWSGGKKGEIRPQDQHARQVVAAYLAKHQPVACGPRARRYYQHLVAKRMLGGSLQLAAAEAWAEERLGVELCERDPDPDVRMCRPLVVDWVPESAGR